MNHSPQQKTVNSEKHLGSLFGGFILAATSYQEKVKTFDIGELYQIQINYCHIFLCFSGFMG